MPPQADVAAIPAINANDILGLLSCGYTIGQIADMTHRSVKRIREDRRRIVVRFETDNIATALVIALSRRFISWKLLADRYPDDAGLARLHRIAKTIRLTAEESGFLKEQITGYPDRTHLSWRSDTKRPPLGTELMARLNISDEEVMDPYILLLAAATMAGYISWDEQGVDG